MTPEYQRLKRLFDSEFGPPGDFGSGFADALAVRRAFMLGLTDNSNEAFKKVMREVPLLEHRLRFAALVGQLTEPKSSANPVSNAFATSLNKLASESVKQEIRKNPSTAFQVIAKYPEDFAVSLALRGPDQTQRSVGEQLVTHQVASYPQRCHNLP